MIFKDIHPSPSLAGMVQCYRLRHFIIPETIAIHPKPYPTRPEHCMAFYPRGVEMTEVIEQGCILQKPRSVISGQYTGRINRYCTREFMMILVVFRPGALHQLTGIPFVELSNGHIDLEDVFPIEGREVNEQLVNCTEYSKMVQVIEAFLTALFRKPRLTARPSDAVFNLIMDAPSKYSLDWLAGQACLSPRQFERKAYDYVGINPRLFARIARFNQSYFMRLAHPRLDWLSIAVATGYHDYQHLVKDYKEFARATPNQLFSEESKVLERSLGLEK